MIVNGRAVSGCLYLASFVDGAEVTTVESLDSRDKLSPVQEAFIESSAFQCGYCTPGFILMVTQLLDEHPDPDDDQIKHYLTGNLCRCATYPEVMDAVKLAAKKRKARNAGMIGAHSRRRGFSRLILRSARQARLERCGSHMVRTRPSARLTVRPGEARR